MKERGILFSAPMVRAILVGAKTQTRRAVKLPADRGAVHVDPGGTIFGPGPYLKVETTGANAIGTMHPRIRCPYGYPGDRLWVREAHQFLKMPNETIVVYRATCDDDSFTYVDPKESTIEQIKVSKWRPGIHLPRTESRITLEITDVRAQRLHDITEEDARAEGVERDTAPCDHTRQSCEDVGCMGPTYRSTFAELWMQINGADSWGANPFVWAISFRRVE